MVPKEHLTETDSFDAISPSQLFQLDLSEIDSLPKLPHLISQPSPRSNDDKKWVTEPNSQRQFIAALRQMETGTCSQSQILVYNFHFQLIIPVMHRPTQARVYAVRKRVADN